MAENVTIRFRTRGQRATSRAVKSVEGKFRKMGARIGGALRRVRKAVFSVRGALTALAGAAAIGRISQKLVNKFATQQEAVRRLEGALRDAGETGSAALQTLTDHASELQRATTAGDEAIIAATASLSRMVPSLDVEGLRKAQQIMIALGAEFFRGDTEAAAQMLGKTLRSTTNALVRYGIELDTSGTAQEKVNELFGQTQNLFEGAKDRADTLTGRITQMKNAWGDLQEVLGGIIADFLDLESGTEGATNRLAEFTEKVKANREEIAAWADIILQSLQFVGQSFKTLFRLAFNFGNILGNAIQVAVAEALGHISNLVNVAARALNFLIARANSIPGVNIEFQFGEFDAEGFFGFAQDRLEDLQGDLFDATDSLANLRDSWLAIRDASREAARAQSRAARAATPPAGGGGGGGGEGAGTQPTGVPEGPVFAGAEFDLEKIKNVEDIVSETAKNLVGEVSNAWDTIAQVAVTAMGQAVQAAINGFDNIANIVVNTVSQIVQTLGRQGGPLSGLLGGFGVPLIGTGLGILGAILSGGPERPQKVDIASVSSRDTLKVEDQRDRGPRSILVQLIAPESGEVIADGLYEMNRLERRDATTRMPSGANISLGGLG